MKKLILDDAVRTQIEANPSMAVPHYLMSSYLYYHKDSCYISDGCYDWLCGVLRAHWETISHRHKELIDESALLAGTGFYITDYPAMVKGAAARLMKDGKFIPVR